MNINKPVIYIVFGLSLSGATEVLSIDTEQWIAQAHRQMMEFDDKYIRVWAEQNQANHLFGGNMQNDVTGNMNKLLEQDIAERMRSTDVIVDKSLSEVEFAALKAANVIIAALRAEVESLKAQLAANKTTIATLRAQLNAESDVQAILRQQVLELQAENKELSRCLTTDEAIQVLHDCQKQLAERNEDAECWRLTTHELMQNRRHFGILYDDTMPPEHLWRVTVYGKVKKYYDGTTANDALRTAGLLEKEATHD